MKFEINVLDEAETDLDDSFLWYESQNPPRWRGFAIGASRSTPRWRGFAIRASRSTPKKAILG
jgi:hypothetical protein